jgi:hypothetical protein
MFGNMFWESLSLSSPRSTDVGVWVRMNRITSYVNVDVYSTYTYVYKVDNILPIIYAHMYNGYRITYTYIFPVCTLLLEYLYMGIYVRSIW